ncbi:MAG: hypothetical protein ACKVUS_02790 [Saprospiraceae bacterium]
MTDKSLYRFINSSLHEVGDKGSKRRVFSVWRFFCPSPFIPAPCLGGFYLNLKNKGQGLSVFVAHSPFFKLTINSVAVSVRLVKVYWVDI